MTSVSSSPLYEGLQSTKDIKWANLVSIDLAQYEEPGGKEILASQLKDAVTTSGFFSVKNFGVKTETIEEQINISRSFFDLPLEEKTPYHDATAWARGDRVGYRPIGAVLRKIQFQGKHRDNVQIYQFERLNGFHPFKQPPILQEKIEKIENFQKVDFCIPVQNAGTCGLKLKQEVNQKIVMRLLVLLAHVLRLPDPESFARPFEFAEPGEDLYRWLKYDAIPVEDSEANDGIYAAKHSDLSTLTLNFCQPVAGLQFLDLDGEWKWVRPTGPDEIVVNTADALAALTGGYFKSGLHRVHAPPKEQIAMNRFSILYFSRVNSSMMMESLKDSPVLQKAGGNLWEGMDRGLNGTQWNKVWTEYLKKQDAMEAEKKAALEAE